MREEIRFLLGHEERSIESIDPTTTVLRYLRETECLTGTKEGCAEGDCGACTVVIGEVGDNGITYRAVNSCIQFVPLLDGKQLITVEHLAEKDGGLHSVQSAMCEQHASQCGFCTPGFVMSMFAQTENGASPDRAELKDVLAGNLCRCTGYGPILDAGEDAVKSKRSGKFLAAEGAVAKTLAAWSDRETVQINGGDKSYFAPATADNLAALCEEHPEAHIISGLTDVGLWVTKMHRTLPTLIYIGAIAELRSIEIEGGFISIAAGVTLSEAHDVFGAHYPDLGELIRRFASLQIRNVATVCGNIANGSPIGDTPPAFIALDAKLVLRKGSARRTIALEDFFIEYGKQERAPGEFVERVLVPLPEETEKFGCYKISKRFDQDISATCGAFRLTLEGDVVSDIRICFGGMAGTPQRATQAENALRGSAWTEDKVRAAMDAMTQDYTPLTDMRGSADYRMRAAQNLVFRFFLETSENTEHTRVLETPEVVHG